MSKSKTKTEVFRYIIEQNRASSSYMSVIWLILMLPVLVERPFDPFVWINVMGLAVIDVSLYFHRNEPRDIEQESNIRSRITYIRLSLANALYWGCLVAYIIFDPSYAHVRFSSALMLAFSTIGGFYVWLVSRKAGRTYMLCLFVPSILVLLFSGHVTAILSTVFIMFSLFIIVQQGDLRAKFFLDSIMQQVKLAETADRYKEISNVDELTQTQNRRFFDKHLKIELESAFQSKESLSLLIIDLDHFKQVNDTHGHTAGDVALRHAADLIRGEVRSNGDLLCRYGGEEFALVLPNCDFNTAFNVSKRICEVFHEREFRHDSKVIPLTVSIGCATVNSAPYSEQVLFELADKALYEAKQNGRDQFIAKQIK